MADCVDKNMIDKDEYPADGGAGATMRRDAGRPLARAVRPRRLRGAPPPDRAKPACWPGLALKRRWAARVNDRSRRPNLVMGANVQVCWEKFCRYWDVEPRIVPMSGERFHLGAAEAVALCDEDTIGVVAILGSTFDGSYEPSRTSSPPWTSWPPDGGPDMPVHVDGASGAMIAPFLDPDLVWDFRLPRVASINTSGHKYGLVYPGVGWVLWRDAAHCPRS